MPTQTPRSRLKSTKLRKTNQIPGNGKSKTEKQTKSKLQTSKTQTTPKEVHTKQQSQQNSVLLQTKHHKHNQKH